ncbi:IS1634 family transposase [Polaribacter cellanae]|uniref:IS1634 family transposase n=1 Tax=Polaribacter cellanae TaxID=2818493 RepID=A0A975CQX7_9FLAO|nr:IS1634 family transposase [Polaribacter cellanae]QTE23602.1 IS1634 family transposase [Polaribacter cellanae]
MGSVSVQIISKSHGKYKVVKSFGSSSIPETISSNVQKAKQEIRRLESNPSLFMLEKDILLESFLSEVGNAQIRTIGPELVFGKIFDHIGFNTISEELFRHLVIARLAFPLSKLKTIEYLYRYQGISLEISSVYRFLDKLNDELKDTVEQISFAHTKRISNNNIGIVFYDMTTLYFEASDEDDLRKTGFSKDGKHSNPQIFLGLLVGLEGYSIGYDVFEGNIYEGHTLIPTIEKISKKFNLSKPVVVADAGLLTSRNIGILLENGYEFILGARIKNESGEIKTKIFESNLKNNEFAVIDKSEDVKLIIAHSDKRAKKDGHNRKKGLERLEKKIKTGKLTKSSINNRGYNKYLKIEGEIKVTIDRDKFEKDKKWDGLKGYITNCSLNSEEIINNYKNLWHIEKAFRMSKTDLRIRPIYHRKRKRIEAHICLSFVAYSIYKELERVLKIEKYPLSVEKAAELTHNMYQIEIILPESLHTKNINLKMDENQKELIEIIDKFY